MKVEPMFGATKPYRPHAPQELVEEYGKAEVMKFMVSRQAVFKTPLGWWIVWGIILCTYIINIYLAILGIMIYDNHPLEESLLTNQDYKLGIIICFDNPMEESLWTKQFTGSEGEDPREAAMAPQVRLDGFGQEGQGSLATPGKAWFGWFKNWGNHENPSPKNLWLQWFVRSLWVVSGAWI